MTTIEINGKEYQLDIDKAKEQGLLKEKDSKPHSWEEYRENILLYQRNKFSADWYNFERTEDFSYKVFGSPEEAKAFCALGKLIQLRDAWIEDWKPDWTDDKEYKWVIQYDCNDVHIYPSFIVSRPLSFPTKDMANDFLETFQDMIEKAKIFL